MNELLLWAILIINLLLLFIWYKSMTSLREDISMTPPSHRSKIASLYHDLVIIDNMRVEIEKDLNSFKKIHDKLNQSSLSEEDQFELIKYYASASASLGEMGKWVNPEGTRRFMNQQKIGEWG